MTQALIFRPSRHPMQAGHGGDKDEWRLEYRIVSARTPNNLTGWASSEDTNHQKRMRFSSKEEAVQYAQRHGITYEIIEYQERKIKPRNYMDNFKEPLIDIAKEKN